MPQWVLDLGSIAGFISLVLSLPASIYLLFKNHSIQKITTQGDLNVDKSKLVKLQQEKQRRAMFLETALNSYQEKNTAEFYKLYDERNSISADSPEEIALKASIRKHEATLKWPF